MADIEVKLSRNVSIWHLIAGVLMALLGVYVWFLSLIHI